MLQQVVLTVSESGAEAKAEPVSAEEATVREEAMSHAWLDAYPVHRSDAQRELGLYSNKLGRGSFCAWRRS